MEAGQAHPRVEQDAPPAPPPEEDLGPVPLHLKILLVALVIYLGWRFAQGVGWVIHHLG